LPLSASLPRRGRTCSRGAPHAAPQRASTCSVFQKPLALLLLGSVARGSTAGSMLPASRLVRIQRPCIGSRIWLCMPLMLKPWGIVGERRRQHGRAGGRWQENQALRRLHFAYADRAAPLALARSLASELQRVPARDALLALHGVPQARPVPCAMQRPIRSRLAARMSFGVVAVRAGPCRALALHVLRDLHPTRCAAARRRSTTTRRCGACCAR